MIVVCSVGGSQSILTLVSSGRLLTWKYTAPGLPVRKQLTHPENDYFNATQVRISDFLKRE